MPSTWYTPPQLAEQLGVDAGKVLAWIHAGELAAIDVAERRGGRPRWRISSDALDTFLARRQSTPAAPAAPRRRRAAAKVVEFY